MGSCGGIKEVRSLARGLGVALAFAVITASAAGAKAYKIEGNLQGTGDSQEFKIELKSDKAEMDFD
jgi:hypothetical protein